MAQRMSQSARKSRPRRPRRPGPPLPPPRLSACLYVRIAPCDVAMFRFLLEAHDNLALFTVLDRHEALLKVVHSPHQERAVRRALTDMCETVPFTVIDFPRPVAAPAS